MLIPKKYRYLSLSPLLFIALIPALISCSSPDEVDLDDEKPTVSPTELPMGFRGLDVFSRAVNLETVYDNFCVRAVKSTADGTRSLVMPDYIVKNIDGGWVYYGLTGSDGSTQLLKYWDLSAKSYTFAAVTPTAVAGSTYSIDDDGVISITLADLSTDWMIARTIRRGVNDASKLLDYDDIAEDADEIDNSADKTSAVFPAPGAPFAEVPLNFHRILAKVVIKAYAESETTLTPLEVGFDNIGIAPATYGTDAGWTTTPLDYQQLYNQTTTITSEQNSRETAQLLTQLFVVPQQQTDDSGNSLVHITVKMNNDGQAHSLDLPGLWEPNNIYTYYLKFEDGDTGQVILFDVSVDPFEKGGEDENEQTNW